MLGLTNMRFVNPFSSAKPVVPAETKSVIGPAVDFPTFLASGGHYDLSAYASMLLYSATMPMFSAIDKRATAFSQIPPRLWDKSKKEFVVSHPVLDLLAKPNADLTRQEFLYQYASYFDITGNAFLLAKGDTNRPPGEIMTVVPSNVTFGFGSKFGFLKIPDTIRFTAANEGSDLFNATVDIRRDSIRFIDGKGTGEAWHTRQFNPMRSTSNFWGLSKAQPLWLEIQQFISGNKTNLSMLKRGTRLSMVWTYKPADGDGEPLTKKQLARLEEQAQKYMGDENAGATPILDQMEITPVQQSNRDMEFNTMQDTMENRINKVYDIPLAKVTVASMTLNNLETSQLQFYDDAVLPLTNYLYAELTNFLLPRYPNSENLEFKFNEHDIPSLKIRIIANAKAQHEIGLNTIDEGRALLGYEGLASGGDVILRPSTLIPVGEDGFTDDEPTTPSATKAFKYMKALKNVDGTQRYTDEEIEAEIFKVYL